MGQPFHVEQSSTAHSTDRKMCLPLGRVILAIRHRALSYATGASSHSPRLLAVPRFPSVETLSDLFTSDLAVSVEGVMVRRPIAPRESLEQTNTD